MVAVVVADGDAAAAVVDFALHRTVDAFAAALLVVPSRTYLARQSMEFFISILRHTSSTHCFCVTQMIVYFGNILIFGSNLNNQLNDYQQ